MNVLETEKLHASGVYPTRDVVLVRGEGVHVFDAEGKRYLDCASGHGVAALGHAHPEVAAAIAEQARTLITCPCTFPNDRRAAYAARLSSILPGEPRRIFFCNSGTEAVEAALKFARFTTGRTRFVAAKRAFHGRTLGALSATWDPRYRMPFEPLLPGASHQTFGDLEAMEQAVDDDTACVIVELVQGEGGVHPAEPDYVAGLRRICDERDALLVVDEVQTGFGRTGRMFACEHYGVVPDLICLGKAIGGGVPMGAVGIGANVDELAVGVHGSTFGGNPLACAAATATLDVLERDGLAERAAVVGAWFLDRLRAIESPLVREVRGLGLMVAVELKQRATPYLRALLDEGVLALPAGPTGVRFLPPLVIDREELETAARALERVLAEG